MKETLFPLNSCDICPLKNQKRVEPRGNINTSIMLVGEAPSDIEVLQGKPFVGPSGKRLSLFLKEAGIKEEDIFITNAIRCQLKSKGDTTNSVRYCNQFLKRDIAKVKPKVIITLGATALISLLGLKNISDNRGKAYKKDNYYVIPTYHPAACLHGQWNKTKLIVLDLLLAKRYAEGNNHRDINYRYITQLEELEKLVEYLLRFKVLAVDIETTTLDFWSGKIFSVQFSGKPGEGFFIPILKYGGGEKWGEENEKPQVLDYLKMLLENGEIAKVFSNAKFDLHFLRKIGIKVKGKIWDTVLMHHLIDENLPHGLKTIGSIYTTVDFQDKKVKKILREKGAAYVPTPSLIRYAIADVDATIDLFQRVLYPGLEKQGLLKIYDRIIEPTIWVTLEMEEKGVNVDKKYLDEFSKKIEDKLIAMTLKIKEEVKDKEFNPNSQKQLSSYLFSNLQLSPYKKTPSGKFSVDEDSLAHIHHPFVDLVMKFRKVEKLYSTFLKNRTDKGIIGNIKADGRIHPKYLIHGAVSGRLSCIGPNIQQMEKNSGLRQCFTAPKGWKFLSTDMEQSEVRVAAYLSHDTEMIKALESGVDFHAECCWAMGMCPKGYLPTKKQRDRAKVFVFGLFLYGGSARSIAKTLGMSEETVKKYGIALRKRFRILDSYLQNLHAKVLLGDCVLENAFGRKRHFYGLEWLNGADLLRTQRQARNYPIQSTSSDILLLSQIRIRNKLKQNGYSAGQVISLHDEGIWEAPDKEVDNVANLIKEEMTKYIPELGFSPVVTVKVSDSWGGKILKEY